MNGPRSRFEFSVPVAVVCFQPRSYFTGMPRKTALVIFPAERIEKAILSLRGQRVMLDRDLAELYGVKAIALRQQVKRNRGRFPDDFMFQVTADEAEAMVSQNVMPSLRSLGGSLPYAFTQEGVAMLSRKVYDLPYSSLEECRPRRASSSRIARIDGRF